MQLNDILSPGRTRSGIQIDTKKKAIEYISELACLEHPEIDPKDIFEALVARERLGSTAIGHGIAIPHCRFEETKDVIGVLLILDAPIDYEALDNTPVDIFFALIAPAENNESHLLLLSQLAEMFSDENLRNSLRTAKDSKTAYELTVSYGG